jgi:signal transduction histidine kinase
MNTAAIALPHYRPFNLDRLRGLYNGYSCALVVSVFLNLWWSLQATLPQLFGGSLLGFAQAFLVEGGYGFLAMVPGIAVAPVVVNLAPRAALPRFATLLALTIFMGWWCLWIEGIHWAWNWPSLGHALDGLVTPGMVVGVLVYHNDRREAADELLRSQISRTSLDTQLMQARLQLLRAQVEPHFLFNSLSVVRALSRSDRAATVAMLDNLIRYFEAALPRLRQGEVLLCEELKLVEAYLAIYRARMGSRLGYQIEARADLGALKVPSMMLLTLVENAIKHGVSPAVEGGLIRVTAKREQEHLVLKVADTGRGLDARVGRGIGLANVRQRLVMMYGADAALTLRCADPRGVVASICVPVH